MLLCWICIRTFGFLVPVLVLGLFLLNICRYVLLIHKRYECRLFDP